MGVMNEWIPVSERLPDKAGLGVLVTAINVFGQKDVFIAFQGYGDFKWYTTSKQYTDDPSSPHNEVSTKWKILAWQYLPDAYDGYIDEGEVVRCKDCKHRYEGIDDSPCEIFNMPMDLLDLWPDFFCAYGERKDSGNREDEVRTK